MGAGMTASPLFAMRCRYCRQSAGRLALSAMLIDAGASTNIDPLKCWAREDDGEHDFSPVADEAA